MGSMVIPVWGRIKNSTAEGFTIIEVMTIILVLGILATLAAPAIPGVIDKAKEKTDLANERTLNSATGIYALDQGVAIADVFPDASTVQEKLQLLFDNGYLKTIPAPTQEDALFTWSEATAEWLLEYNDPQIIVLKDSLTTSSITYTDFIGKNKLYGSYDSSRYRDDYWNGYLEMLLEKGDTGDNTRVQPGDPQYGNNTIGYVNPVNGNKTVVNYNDLNWAPVGPYIPPAIFITSNPAFSYSNIGSYIATSGERVKGTMIFYKDNTTENQAMQIFYVREDGSLSSLVPISTVLPMN